MWMHNGPTMLWVIKDSGSAERELRQTTLQESFSNRVISVISWQPWWSPKGREPSATEGKSPGFSGFGEVGRTSHDMTWSRFHRSLESSRATVGSGYYGVWGELDMPPAVRGTGNDYKALASVICPLTVWRGESHSVMLQKGEGKAPKESITYRQCVLWAGHGGTHP